MIQRLRKKVFFGILFSTSGVLLLTLLIINSYYYLQSMRIVNSVLHSATELLATNPNAEENESFQLLQSITNEDTSVLLLNEEGTILNQLGDASLVDQSTISSILPTAFAEKDGDGHEDGWIYKVFSYENNQGVGVLFLNAKSLQKEAFRMLLVSFVLFMIAFIIFALLADRLSRIIVKPVEENMLAQKRFVADASHELKTPLTVISANATVLQESVGDNKWLHYIQEQTSRMTELVNELLQLSRLEDAGQAAKKPVKEPFDLADSMLAVSLPFESVAFERGITIESDLPDSLVGKGDAKAFQQIATILIDNAIKHAADGSQIKVSLSGNPIRSAFKGKEPLTLSVTNVGDTIPSEAIPHLFERFYRVDKARTHSSNSYGLGLSIAKELADQNQYRLSLSSKDGITTFTLQIMG